MTGSSLTFDGVLFRMTQTYRCVARCVLHFECMPVLTSFCTHHPGKKGVGLGKRAPSPGLAERAAKAMKADEEAKHESFRDRTRTAFEERRIVGQLTNATKTLQSLDEKAGVEVRSVPFLS